MKRQLMSLTGAFTAGFACILLAFPLCGLASDATHLAFTSAREGNDEIYMIDINGKNLQNLTNHPARDWYPAFSPDGRWMAFVSDRDDTNRIYLMNRNRNELRPLTTHLGARAGFDPDWSPDGQWMVFTSRADIPKADPNIYKINVNTGDLQQLTDKGYNRFPKWSPDGDQIIFYSARKAGNDIYVMRSNGTGLKRVVRRKESGGSPAWSPDGRQIAYSRFGIGGVGLYILTIKGQNDLRITGDHAWYYNTAWSPDGQWIAHEFEENPWIPPRESDIHLISPDGIKTRQLTKHPGRDRYPAWVPPAFFLSVAPTAEKQTTLWGSLKHSIHD